MDYEYMRALFYRFVPQVKRNTELYAYMDQLKETLNPEQRKLLLHLTDEETAYCDDQALESFVCGYCLGSGIAEELRGHRYSFVEDEASGGLA